jgi:SAM-dependent methyltransferase
MARLAELDAAAARDWIGRWERQQEVYLADREERFTALIDAVEAGAGRPDPLVVDLGCGPGSLAVRLLDRLPAAVVVAVDADPVTLSLGRAAYAGRPGLRFADVDLGIGTRPGSRSAGGRDCLHHGAALAHRTGTPRAVPGPRRLAAPRRAATQRRSPAT